MEPGMGVGGDHDRGGVVIGVRHLRTGRSTDRAVQIEDGGEMH